MDIAINNDEAWTVDGNSVINFRLVRETKDLESSIGDFKPVMCHQIFGPQERIYGYKNLAVDLYFSAAYLNPYLRITYTDKICADNKNGVEADDIEGILTEKLKIPFCRNIDEFSRGLKDEVKFRPMGEMLKSYDQGDKNYVFYKTEASRPGFMNLHEKLQTFLLWFVDSASFIDVDDEKWQFFILYEKYSSNGETMYAVAGYATVYEYYAYPQNLRPRLSQMLILSPFQRRGLGTELLRAVYDYYRGRKDVLDITVEDPSEDFQSLRDYVDCHVMLGHNLIANVNPLTLKTVQDAAKSLKISKRQARRVYEILRLKQVNRNDLEQYRQYRLEVKNRLNIPFLCEQQRMQKFAAVAPEALTGPHNGREHRLKILRNNYEALEEVYNRVIDRLNNDSKA